MSDQPKFLRDAEPRAGRRCAVYLCRCGREFTWPRIRVECGYKVDCGCGALARRVAASSGLKSKHPDEYSVWQAMKYRCLNPRSKDWPRYGGAGVVVCDAWATSFAAFLADMGPRPSLSHSIERIDNRAGYAPGNAVWATRSQQQRNKSSSYIYRVNGEEFRAAKDAAERLGVGTHTIYRHAERSRRYG